MSRSLDWYPRPPGDTGMIIHFRGSSSNPAEAAQWARVLKANRYSWVKLLHSDPGTYRTFQEAGIMVVLRPYEYQPFPDPWSQFDAGVIGQALSEGVRYIEPKWNEWNLKDENQPGRFDPSTDVDQMAKLWLDFAEHVQGGGGIPGTPACSPGGDDPDDSLIVRWFGHLYRFYTERAVKVFEAGAFIAVHNYSIGHPPMYPDSEPSNPATWYAEQNWTAAHFGSERLFTRDSNSWRKWEKYAAAFQRIFGFYIPAISTEGGTHDKTHDDIYYPEVNAGIIHAHVLDEAVFMRDKAPKVLLASMAHWLAIRGGKWPKAHEIFTNDDPNSPNDIWRPIYADVRGMGQWQRRWADDTLGDGTPVDLPKGPPPRLEYQPFQSPMVFGAAPLGAAVWVHYGAGEKVLVHAGDKPDWNKPDQKLFGWQVDINAPLANVFVMIEGFQATPALTVNMGGVTAFIWADPTVVPAVPIVPVPPVPVEPLSLERQFDLGFLEYVQAHPGRAIQAVVPDRFESYTEFGYALQAVTFLQSGARVKGTLVYVPSVGVYLIDAVLG